MFNKNLIYTIYPNTTNDSIIVLDISSNYERDLKNKNKKKIIEKKSE